MLFPVRYGLSFYMLYSKNSVSKGCSVSEHKVNRGPVKLQSVHTQIRKAIKYEDFRVKNTF
jgi:hypothetical protein